MGQLRLEIITPKYSAAVYWLDNNWQKFVFALLKIIISCLNYLPVSTRLLLQCLWIYPNSTVQYHTVHKPSHLVISLSQIPHWKVQYIPTVQYNTVHNHTVHKPYHLIPCTPNTTLNSTIYPNSSEQYWTVQLQYMFIAAHRPSHHIHFAPPIPHRTVQYITTVQYSNVCIVHLAAHKPYNLVLSAPQIPHWTVQYGTVQYSTTTVNDHCSTYIFPPCSIPSWTEQYILTVQ